MAKKTESKKAEPKKYYVNDHILREGYIALIDGMYFVVDAKTTYVGVRAGKQVELVDRPSVCWQAAKDNYKPNVQGVNESEGEGVNADIAVDHNAGLTEIGPNYFVDLTKEQERILAIATVINFPKD